MFGFLNVGEVTLSLCLVGIWWIGFGTNSFLKLLPKNESKKKVSRYFQEWLPRIEKVFLSLKKLKDMKMYLVAYFFYNMGVQTIMLLAILFGTKELN